MTSTDFPVAQHPTTKERWRRLLKEDLRRSSVTRLLVDILGLKHSFLSSEVVAQGGVLSSYQVFSKLYILSLRNAQDGKAQMKKVLEKVFSCAS